MILMAEITRDVKGKKVTECNIIRQQSMVDGGKEQEHPFDMQIGGNAQSECQDVSDRIKCDKVLDTLLQGDWGLWEMRKGKGEHVLQ